MLICFYNVGIGCINVVIIVICNGFVIEFCWFVWVGVIIVTVLFLEIVVGWRCIVVVVGVLFVVIGYYNGDFIYVGICFCVEIVVIGVYIYYIKIELKLNSFICIFFEVDLNGNLIFVLSYWYWCFVLYGFGVFIE